jgi:hypothetical protein
MKVHLFDPHDNRTLPRYPVGRLVGHAEGPVPLVVFNGSSLQWLSFVMIGPIGRPLMILSVPSLLVVDDDSILALGQKALALTTTRMLFLHFDLKLPLDFGFSGCIDCLPCVPHRRPSPNLMQSKLLYRFFS